MPSRLRAKISKGFSLVLSASMACPPSLWANPTDGVVVGGGASIVSDGSTVTIEQHTDRAVIDWGGFSIGAGELTEFIQPSELSAVLNRVTGGDPSAIYGTLQANGQVFLINPNGILVGPDGAVNTQGFVASTLDVDNGAFLAGGDLLFSGDSLAGVQNEGSISALGGNVVMIARTVSNTGEIRAADGTAALAAGSEVLYKPLDEERVFVQAGSELSADIGVDQQGRIEAAAAELKAAGGNVYGLAVNNGGVVRADSVEAWGGRVFLTAEGGKVSNSGELGAVQGAEGGEVRLTGDQVALEAGSTIDAGALEVNADSRILINADVATSGEQTYNGAVDVGANAILSAGGGIRFRGTVDSSNLSKLTTSSQGDTAFSEAVGADSLGDLDVTARDGGNIYFESTLDSDGTVTAGSEGYTEFWDAVGNRTLGGLNVTSEDSIYFYDELNSAPSAALTLNAARYISFDYGVGGDSLGDLDVTSGQSIEFYGSLDSDGAVTTSAGGYTGFYGPVGDRALGGLNVDSGSGITFDDTLDSSAGAELALTSGGDIMFSGKVGASSLGDLSVATVAPFDEEEGSGGAIYFQNTLDSDGTVTANSADGVRFSRAVGARSLGGLDVASNNGGDITFRGTLDSNSGAEVSVNSSGDAVFRGAVGASSLGDLTVATGGAVRFLGTLDSDGSVAVNSAGGLELAGEAGARALGSLGASAAGDISLNGGDVTTSGGQTYTGAVNFGRNSTLSALGDVAFNGPVTAGDLTVRGGDVSWNGALAGADLRLFGTNLSMNGAVESSGENGVLMVAENSFSNPASAGITVAEGAKWLIYSADPAHSVPGGLAGAEQFSTTYADGPAPAFEGSGFLYRASPEPESVPSQELPDSENLADFQASLGQTFVDASGGDSVVDSSGQDASEGAFNDIVPESDLKDAVSDEPQSSSGEKDGKGKKSANTARPQPSQK